MTDSRDQLYPHVLDELAALAAALTAQHGSFTANGLTRAWLGAQQAATGAPGMASLGGFARALEQFEDDGTIDRIPGSDPPAWRFVGHERNTP